MAAHPPKDRALLPILFFKTILKSNLQSLQLPNRFTNRYGRNLSNPVFFKPPDGTQWEVYWTKQNGEIWFEKGWKEFVENYSLDQGHFVFFKYEGTSNIDVRIVDQSALEIQYPSTETPGENESLDHSDDESVEILDEGTDSDQNASQFESEEGSERSSSLNWPKQARAQELARKFISCNPFFTIFIKPINLTSYRLCIPNLEGYINKRKKNVTLEVGARSWNLKLLGYKLNLFGAGWRGFAKENELEAGDVCIFELILRNDPVFKVHIFKSQS